MPLPNKLIGLLASADKTIGNSLSGLSNYQPNYLYGSLLPYKINNATGEKSFAAPGLLKSMAAALTAPQRAYQGLLDPQSPQGIKEAINLAGLLTEGGYASSAYKDPAAGTISMSGAKNGGSPKTTLYRGGVSRHIDERGGTPVFFTPNEETAQWYADLTSGSVEKIDLPSGRILDLYKLPKIFTEDKLSDFLKVNKIDYDPSGISGARNQIFGYLRDSDQFMKKLLEAGFIGWKAPEINPAISQTIESEAYAIHPEIARTLKKAR